MRTRRKPKLIPVSSPTLTLIVILSALLFVTLPFVVLSLTLAMGHLIGRSRDPGPRRTTGRRSRCAGTSSTGVPEGAPRALGADELEDPPPRVGARIPVLLVALVEERVRGSGIRHELVRHLSGVERRTERIHHVSRDRLIRAAEDAEAQHRGPLRGAEAARRLDRHLVEEPLGVKPEVAGRVMPRPAAEPVKRQACRA